MFCFSKRDDTPLIIIEICGVVSITQRLPS